MSAEHLPAPACAIYDQIKDDPIVSPHGHCDPAWFATDAPFPDPASLIVIPDHYLFRMLYSQGVPLSDLGIGTDVEDRDPRAIWRVFAAHWHLFLGTPSHAWLTETFRTIFGIDEALAPANADAIYDSIAAEIAKPAFRPRALFDRFGIELLATTDSATDPLDHHQAIRKSAWGGRVVPTFRPDALLDPMDPRFAGELKTLAAQTGTDCTTLPGYLEALRQRRAAFKALGATATDHAIEIPQMVHLADDELGALFDRARTGEATEWEAATFHGAMLVRMAEMSLEDGLVMQLHAGSRRNTNPVVLKAFGRDMGADIPVATDWVRGLAPLLERVGNDPRFRLILFTLDETTYARELAPMAGHWPCLRIGPPWWFHDSPRGIARFFDQVVETAGYWNLAGFNDDTRAFLSIPARHDVWRQGVALHLADQVERGVLGTADAVRIARLLSTDLARATYRL